jgi:hypothetical protein
MSDLPDALRRPHARLLARLAAARKPMGAYYTPGDVANYVCRGTIVPALLDAARRSCPGPFARLWRLFRDDPDRYLPAALRHGVALPLPPEVASGLHDASARDAWNRPAPAEYGLPTETWREHVGRRRRCEEVRARLAGGEVASVDDLVTLGIDLAAFARDAIARADDAGLVRAFRDALQTLSVLDPTCGSGEFLLAALDTLEPLHDACLRATGAPGRLDVVRRSIVANNLHGVDLMAEAVEVCKLRLSLKLAEAGAEPDGPINVRRGDVVAVGGRRAFDWSGEFPAVMGRGGFDAIIGNPPYVEQAGVDGYATRRCGNLYAFVVERSRGLLSPRGRLGMVVPHSAFCTDRMGPLMGLLGGGARWVSSYAIRPCKLFAGVDQRLAVFLTAPGEARTFSTRYHRWHEPYRPHLFDLLRYADVSALEYRDSLPRMGDPIEEGVWRKLHARRPLGEDLRGPAVAYYHNAPRYWVRAMTFVPYFSNERDGEKLSTQVRPLPAPTAADAAAVAAVLNSSLFYWWFVLLSDCRHLNRREIDRFPLGLSDVGAGLKRALAGLCAKLMADYRRNAVRKECRYRATGRVAYDEFYPRRSKAILDDIDRALAPHYGLTPEEVDLIVNYDIKYRMREV